MSSSLQREVDGRLRNAVLRDEANGFCADCFRKGPSQFCFHYGILLCETCAKVHRDAKRKCKPTASGEMTMEDVQRLESVGNDRCNRKFLSRWDSKTFPPPTPGSEKQVQEFIWLKYEGSWLKKKEEKMPSNTAKGNWNDGASSRQTHPRSDYPGQLSRNDSYGDPGHGSGPGYGYGNSPAPRHGGSADPRHPRPEGRYAQPDFRGPPPSDSRYSGPPGPWYTQPEERNAQSEPRYPQPDSRYSAPEARQDWRNHEGPDPRYGRSDSHGPRDLRPNDSRYGPDDAYGDRRRTPYEPQGRPESHGRDIRRDRDDYDSRSHRSYERGEKESDHRVEKQTKSAGKKKKSTRLVDVDEEDSDEAPIKSKVKPKPSKSRTQIDDEDDEEDEIPRHRTKASKKTLMRKKPARYEEVLEDAEDEDEDEDEEEEEEDDYVKTKPKSKVAGKGGSKGVPGDRDSGGKPVLALSSDLLGMGPVEAQGSMVVHPPPPPPPGMVISPGQVPVYAIPPGMAAIPYGVAPGHPIYTGQPHMVAMPQPGYPAPGGYAPPSDFAAAFNNMNLGQPRR